MSYHPVEAPSRSAIAGLIAAVIVVLVLVVAVVASAAATRPVRLIVDGRTLSVPVGTTIGDLIEAETFAIDAGDLIAVDGSVAEEGGGEPARVLRDGQPVGHSQRLYRGDVLTSSLGQDRPESVEVTTIPVPYGVKVEGSGPIAEVERDGQDGSRRVTRGIVSGIEITSVMLVEPVTEVVLKRAADPGSKLVALTFDDGPWPQSTQAILDVLDEHEVRATFFMLGGRVQRNPDLVRKMARDGHLLGAHSVSHRPFSRIKSKEVRQQIVRGRRIIRKASGVDTPWLRPPYGSMNSGAWRAVRKEGARVVLWDVDSNDWKKPGAKKITRAVVKRVKPGSIVLLHDGGGDRTQTVEALPGIIEGLKNKGYAFVTVEDLVDAPRVRKGPAARAIVKGHK